MKVLHLTHGYPPESRGGIEAYLERVVAGQAAQGHRVEVLSGSMQLADRVHLEEQDVAGQRVWRLHRDDLYFDHWAKAYHPGVEQVLADFLARMRPDLVHVHQWIRLTCNLVEIADGLGIPSVVTLHDLYTSCPRCFRVDRSDAHCERRLDAEECGSCVPRFGHESEAEIAAGIAFHREQYLRELQMAGAVLAASQATVDLIARSTGMDPGLVELLPLAYERRFAADARRWAAPASDEPLRFGYWGNVTVRKGAQVLVAAFRELVTQGLPRPVELHLFGNTDTEELDRELRGLADGLPVHFHGRFEYEQVAAAGLHLAVFPMLCFETYGFVLDEALELGIPTVLTDLGAMPERAGAASLRVPPNDVPAMASALRRVVGEPGLLEQLAAAAQPAGMDPDAHLQRLFQVYDRAVERGPGKVSPLPAAQRSRLLALQRESALRGAIQGPPQ